MEESPYFRVPNHEELDFEQNLDLPAQVFSSVQKLPATKLILSIPVEPGDISGQTHHFCTCHSFLSQIAPISVGKQ